MNPKNNRSNILLKMEKNEIIAVICDFGLARMSSQTNVF